MHIEIFVASRRPREIFVSLDHFRFKNGYTSLSRDHITCSPIMISWPCIPLGRTDVRMVRNDKHFPKTKYPRVCIYLIIGNYRCMLTTRRKFTLHKIHPNFPKIRLTYIKLRRSFRKQCAPNFYLMRIRCNRNF